MENGLLKFIYDQTGESYKTPYACINEPTEYGVDKEKEKLEKASGAKDKTLKLKIRNAKLFEDKTVEIEDSETVRELKERYADLYDVDDIGEEGEWVRLLAHGRELKTDAYLYQYEFDESHLLIGVLK